MAIWGVGVNKTVARGDQLCHWPEKVVISPMKMPNFSDWLNFPFTPHFPAWRDQDFPTNMTDSTNFQVSAVGVAMYSTMNNRIFFFL
jgi:hypothetical protein